MEVQRESVFVSALRTFCRLFFGVCAIFLALIAMTLLYNSLSNNTTIESKTKIKYLPDAEEKKELVASTSPVILQINIHGVIGEPKSLNSDTIQNILVESRTGDLKNNRVKGILLHLNTPGGTVVDSDNIYRMLKDYKERYKVPIFAYVDGLCASGGVYVSCAADQVYSGRSGIIGSVGTIAGPFFNIYETLQKMGMKTETVTAGLDKDMMTPFRPWKDDEDASLRAIINYYYRQFVDIVVSARTRMDRNKLIEVYGARVFDPILAQEYGYVDHIDATRNTTLLALMQQAEIDPSKPYQVVTLEPKSEWLSNLFNEKSPIFTGKIEHTFDLGVPQIRDQVAYLYLPLEK